MLHQQKQEMVASGKQPDQTVTKQSRRKPYFSSLGLGESLSLPANGRKHRETSLAFLTSSGLEEGVGSDMVDDQGSPVLNGSIGARIGLTRNKLRGLPTYPVRVGSSTISHRYSGSSGAIVNHAIGVIVVLCFIGLLIGVGSADAIRPHTSSYIAHPAHLPPTPPPFRYPKAALAGKHHRLPFSHDLRARLHKDILLRQNSQPFTDRADKALKSRKDEFPTPVLSVPVPSVQVAAAAAAKKENSSYGPAVSRDDNLFSLSPLVSKSRTGWSDPDSSFLLQDPWLAQDHLIMSSPPFQSVDNFGWRW